MTATPEGTQNAVPPTSVQELDTGTVRRNAVTLNKWSQGDLIGPVTMRARFPLSWLMPVGTDPITGLSSPAQSVKPYFHHGSTAPLVLASQTCDVSGADTGIHHPFVMAVPLSSSQHLGAQTCSLANQKRVPYIIPSLYRDPTDESVTWYADLRLLVPLSKGVLLAQKSGGPAFDADWLMRFAVGIAHKFSRPAVDDVLSTELPVAINAYVKNIGPTNKVFAATEEVRLLVTQGGWTSPGTGAQVVVIVDRSVLTKARQVWTAWEPPVRKKLSTRGVKLGATVVTTATTLKASIYRQTSALRIEALGPPLWA